MNQPSSTANTSGTVSLADEEGVKSVVTDALFSLWATVNNLSRLRPSQRSRYRVAVFGSARTDPQHGVGLSDAYIVAPGGIGTVLESMMIWQLLQVRRLHDIPLIFAGRMWQSLVDWAGAQMLRPGFELASPADMRIPHCVEDADQAIAIVREHHARWQARHGDSGTPT